MFVHSIFLSPFLLYSSCFLHLDQLCSHIAEDSGSHRETPTGEAADAGRGQETARGDRGAQHLH